MFDLWNSEKLSFECLFLVRLAIALFITILAGGLSCFFMFLIVWFCFSAFGWVLIPISFLIFVHCAMQETRKQI
ncbi:hypothetical protein B9J09_05510 [Xylella fastidiosa subsp. pauca]|nr:hypothetical protein B9J09_05280 [Xylella fastidiosa subsp. pauca]ARO68560.1 hypothetical protein B9J09_05510 [Xylella fastidiosa subsp. pauca]KIA57675.1 hypothetical protein RA12_08160 [Xylella fastidiosa]KXB14298.1 hypothetical protein ADT31_09335 [Xylella fastidiosa]TNW25356.1 hypothetical protein EIP74_02350 [Xylella fastidiosa subsp. pauca]